MSAGDWISIAVSVVTLVAGAYVGRRIGKR